jgi:nicotinamidase-related amidase
MTTALVLIDVQQAFDDPSWGRRNNPAAEANIARLVADFRAAGRPIIHVKHDSTEPASTLRPDRPGNAFKPEAVPAAGEPLFAKTVNSAFIGTGLEAHLRERGITGLVVVGFITNHCVSTTARMAGNLGFHTTVVADACATFDFKDADGALIPAELMHRIGLAELRGEFATILTTEELLSALAEAELSQRPRPEARL